MAAHDHDGSTVYRYVDPRPLSHGRRLVTFRGPLTALALARALTAMSADYGPGTSRRAFLFPEGFDPRTAGLEVAPLEYEVDPYLRPFAPAGRVLGVPYGYADSLPDGVFVLGDFTSR